MVGERRRCYFVVFCQWFGMSCVAMCFIYCCGDGIEVDSFVVAFLNSSRRLMCVCPHANKCVYSFCVFSKKSACSVFCR